MLPSPATMLLGNTNRDRLNPNLTNLTSAPRPLPSPRRRTEQLIGGTGGQFEDHTIPDGDPLPDVDTPAAMLLADLASSRAHSPNNSNHGHQHPFLLSAGDKQAIPTDGTLRPSVMDLTLETLRPHASKIPEPVETVEKWRRLPRHYKYLGDAKGAKANEHGGSKIAVNGKYYSPGQIRRSEPKKEYPCNQCQRVFHSRSELRHHARRYEKRPYTCDQCDRSFLYPKDLRRHKTTHSGTKQYRCRLCPKSFSRKDNLRRHINNEHDKTDVPLSPSIEAVEMSGRRRNGSEDSDEGGPENGHSNGNRNSLGYGDANGNSGGNNGQNSYSMPTDVAEHSGTGSAGDAAGGGAGGGGTSHGSYHGKKTYDVHTHGHTAPKSFVIENGEDVDGEQVYEPTDGGDFGSSFPYMYTANTGTTTEAAGSSKFSKNETTRPGRSNEVINSFSDTKSQPGVADSRRLICPFRRWKPNVYTCPKSYPDIRALIHHLKNKHAVWFHAQCTQLFGSEEDGKLHFSRKLCCRKCRRGFESDGDFNEHKPCEKISRKPEEDWQLIYEQACRDDIEHCPWFGPDYEGMEELARQRYEGEQSQGSRRRRQRVESSTPIPMPEVEGGHEEDERIDSLTLMEEYDALKAENAELRARVEELEIQAQISISLEAQVARDTETIAELRMQNADLLDREQKLRSILHLGGIEPAGTPLQSQQSTATAFYAQSDVSHQPFQNQFSYYNTPSNHSYSTPFGFGNENHSSSPAVGYSTQMYPGIGASSTFPSYQPHPMSYQSHSAQPVSLPRPQSLKRPSVTDPSELERPNKKSASEVHSEYREVSYDPLIQYQHAQRSGEDIDFRNPHSISIRSSSGGAEIGVDSRSTRSFVTSPSRPIRSSRDRRIESVRHSSIGGFSMPPLVSETTASVLSSATADPVPSVHGQIPAVQITSPLGNGNTSLLEPQMRQQMETGIWLGMDATQDTMDRYNTPKPTHDPAASMPGVMEQLTISGNTGDEALCGIGESFSGNEQSSFNFSMLNFNDEFPR